MQIARHLPDDARLLRVLAPEKRLLRLNDFEQLQYDGRDAAKMSGARRALPGAPRDPRHSPRCGIPADKFPRPPARTNNRRPRLPVFRGPLQACVDISENPRWGQTAWDSRKWKRSPAEHSARAARTSDRCPAWSAPIVGTKPVDASFGSRLAATCFIHSMVWMVSKGFSAHASACGVCQQITQAEGGESSTRGRGLFAIIADQVRGDRLHAELPQHRDDLAAVIAGVIGQLMQPLPERIRKWIARKTLVVDDAV